MNQMKGLVKMTSSFLLMLPIMTIYRNNQNSIDSIDARFSWLVAMLGASCLHGEYIGHFPTGFYCVRMLIATLPMGFTTIEKLRNSPEIHEMTVKPQLNSRK